MKYRRSTLAVAGLILFVSATAVLFASMDLDGEEGEAAVIQLEGAITASSSSFQSGTISPEDVRSLVDRAGEPDAIIFEWNSGGGAVVASKEVKRTIEDVEVPTVCRFRDVAASGAYLSSLGCDRIVADSASITGSIGVKSSYLEFSGLLKKLGIEYVNVSSGSYKERNSRFQNASEEDIASLKNMTGIIHEQFLGTVEDERDLSEESMRRIETGTILLGSEAEELGLVDELGGREVAVEEAEELSDMNLTTYKVEEPTEFNPLRLLTSGASLEGLFGTNSLLKASLL